MKKLIILLSLGLAAPAMAQQAGEVFSIEQKLNLTPSGIAAYLSGNLGNAGNNTELSAYLGSFDVGLKAYKITYYTKGLSGALVKATGLVMYPNVNYKLSTVVSEHPTTDLRQNVPSNLKGIYSVGFALELSYALNGYIVMAPDYVGMGSGDGVHPYVNYLTEAGATVDFVKAANTVLAQMNVKRYDEYFIAGYSQGAHAAMSTLKFLNTANPGNLKFKYAFTGGGPFDLSGTTLNEAFLQKTTYPSTAFLGAVIGTCQNAGYSIYPGTNYAAVISPAYQQAYDFHVIQDNGGLSWGPSVWRDLFKPAFVTDLTNNQNAAARKCLKANDVDDWYNKTPITMGTSTNDKTIPPNNTYNTVSTQRAYYPWYSLDKYNIGSLTWGPLDHAGGAIPFIIAANAKFNTLRSGGFFNQWAFLFSKNGSENADPEQLITSYLKPDFKDVKITEVVHFNDPRSSSERISGNNAIAQLSEGVYLLKTNAENEKQYIPYIKATPVQLAEKDIVQSEVNGILNLKINTEDLQNINVFNSALDLLKTVSKKEYMNANGLDMRDFAGALTIEVVSAYHALQFNKNIGMPAELSSDVIFAVKDNHMEVQSKINMSGIKVYDMNGTLVENLTLKSREYRSKSFEKGVFIITVQLENGKTATGKVKI